eukprot:1719852-Heterocapsa_arctica.AAC.1
MAAAAPAARRSQPSPRHASLHSHPGRHPAAAIDTPTSFGESIGGIFHEAPPARDWRTTRPR